MSELTSGHIYQNTTGRFPFDVPYAIFVETLKTGWHRFIWNGKDMIMHPEDHKYSEVGFFDFSV